MCLYIDKEATQQFILDNKDKEEVTVYKNVDCPYPGHFAVTPHQEKRVKAGKLVGRRSWQRIFLFWRPPKDEIHDKAVHVYLTKEGAKLGDGRYTLECTAKMKDLIAIGVTSWTVYTGRDSNFGYEAIPCGAFKKIYISQSQIDRFV